jgi:hypothetical protein
LPVSTTLTNQDVQYGCCILSFLLTWLHLHNNFSVIRQQHTQNKFLCQVTTLF